MSKRRAVIVLVVVAFALLALDFLFTARYVNATQNAQKAQQAQQQRAQERLAQEQRVEGCREFAALVESIVRANADTKHAVAASKSFGQLFTVAVTHYYATTGCSKLVPP